MLRRLRAGCVLLALAAGCRDGRLPAPQAASAESTPQARSSAAPAATEAGTLAADESRMPRFEDHPATDTFTGTPAPVDLSSAPGARRFRTVLSAGAAKGPNFAGHYTVVSWGCGTACQSFAIVDARTGRVTFGSHPLSVGVEYRLDSSLLITDPPDQWRAAYGEDAEDAVGGWAQSRYFRWDGERLIALDSLLLGKTRRGEGAAARK